MGKYNNALKSLIIGLSLTGSIYAQNAKIEKISIPTKKDLIATIRNIKNASQTDKETETIISFMSNIDNEGLKTVLEKYGYTTTIIDTLKPEEPDSALYATIREMNEKYDNPKISADRSTLINGKGKKYRGEFSPKRLKNKIDINPEIYNDKLEMLVIRLAELSHAKQYKQNGMITMIKRLLKEGVTWIKNDFSYKKLYNQKRTIEGEAHKEIEPALYLEFLEVYLSEVDATDKRELKRTGILIDYLTHNMRSDTMDPKIIQYMAAIQDGRHKKSDIQQSDINDIIKDIQKDLEEIQSEQTVENIEAKIEE